MIGTASQSHHHVSRNACRCCDGRRKETPDNAENVAGQLLKRTVSDKSQVFCGFQAPSKHGKKRSPNPRTCTTCYTTYRHLENAKENAEIFTVCAQPTESEAVILN